MSGTGGNITQRARYRAMPIIQSKPLWPDGMCARVESLLAVYPLVFIDWSLALAVAGFSAPGGRDGVEFALPSLGEVVALEVADPRPVGAFRAA
jgi:hypothetical protein